MRRCGAATPYGGGRVIALLAHKKYEIVTVKYRDSDGGFHGAIFQLNKGEAQVLKRVRIPVKWGTDSGEVGQCRSEATLGISMIGEVPHMSQESSGTVVQSASFRFFFRGDRKVAFR